MELELALLPSGGAGGAAAEAAQAAEGLEAAPAVGAGAEDAEDEAAGPAQAAGLQARTAVGAGAEPPRDEGTSPDPDTPARETTVQARRRQRFGLAPAEDLSLAAARGERDATRRCSAVRQALALGGANAQARSMASQCESQARDLVRRAARLRGSQQTTMYRRAQQMVAPSSPVYRDASRGLAAAASSRTRRAPVYDEDE